MVDILVQFWCGTNLNYGVLVVGYWHRRQHGLPESGEFVGSDMVVRHLLSLWSTMLPVVSGAVAVVLV